MVDHVFFLNEQFGLALHLKTKPQAMGQIFLSLQAMIQLAAEYRDCTKLQLSRANQDRTVISPFSDCLIKTKIKADMYFPVVHVTDNTISTTTFCICP